MEGSPLGILFEWIEIAVGFVIVLFILLKITEAGGNAIRHDYELLLGIHEDEDNSDDDDDDEYDEDDDDDDDEDDYDHHEDEDN